MENVYFNFFIIGYLIATAFYWIAFIFISTIPNRSKAAFHLAMGFFLTGIAGIAYTVSVAYYDPISSFHRYFTIFFVLGTITHNTQFLFTFPEDRFPRTRKIFLLIMWAINITGTTIFIIKSLDANYHFHFSGHYWDFSLDEYSKIIAYCILSFSLITFFTGIFRTFVTKGKVKWAVLTCALALALGTISPGIANLLSRDGAIGREIYMIVLVVLTTIGYFVMLIVFINNTKDRTSFMTKIIGICLVSFLVLLLFVGYYTAIVNERTYDIAHIIN